MCIFFFLLFSFIILSGFKALVNELNRMPMTTETLRMRVRKAEIEKELKLLETDIRVFSKSKVYVKHKEQNI